MDANIFLNKHFVIKHLKHFLWVIFRGVLIFSICFIIVYPLLLKTIIAFKDLSDVYDPSVVWIPKKFTLGNIEFAFQLMKYPTSFLNTAFISGVVMILQTFMCAIAGYSFARLKFIGQNVLFGLVIFSIVVPPQTIIIPLYMTFNSFWLFGGIKLINTHWPIFLSAATCVGIKTGLYIYIYRQFFKGIPKELEEAAMVDGAGILRTFMTIILPNAVPMLITVALFSFVWQWNDAYFSTIYMNNANLLSIRVMAVASEAFHDDRTGMVVDPNELSLYVNAGVILTITPLILMYTIVQRHFVEGIERSGIVG